MKLFFIFLLINLATGCGLLQSISENSLYCKERAMAKDPLHVWSCGPEALYDVIHYMKIDPFVTREKISNHIQTSSILPIRGALSIFNEKARNITFPQEMLGVLKVYNISAIKKKSLNEIKRNESAIVLIRDKNSLFSYHWIFYPKHSLRRIGSFFGVDSTDIVSVYILKNNNDDYFLSNHLP